MADQAYGQTDVWSDPGWLRATAQGHGTQAKQAQERLKELQEEAGRQQQAGEFGAAHQQQLAEFNARNRESTQRFEEGRQDRAQRQRELETYRQEGERQRAAGEADRKTNSLIRMLEVLPPGDPRVVQIQNQVLTQAGINPNTVPPNEKANVVQQQLSRTNEPGARPVNQTTQPAGQQPTGQQPNAPTPISTGPASTGAGVGTVAPSRPYVSSQDLQPGPGASPDRAERAYDLQQMLNRGEVTTTPTSSGVSPVDFINQARAEGRLYTEGGIQYNTTPEMRAAQQRGEHYNLSTGEWRGGITPSSLVEATPGASRVDPNTGIRTERLPSGGLAGFADRSTAQGRSAIGTAQGGQPVPAPETHDPVANRFVNAPGFGVGGGSAVPHAEAVSGAPTHPPLNAQSGGPMTTPPGYTGGPASGPGTPFPPTDIVKPQTTTGPASTGQPPAAGAPPTVPPTGGQPPVAGGVPNTSAKGLLGEHLGGAVDQFMHALIHGGPPPWAQGGGQPSPPRDTTVTANP